MDLGNLDLGLRRGPTTWVAFETTTQTYDFKPKRRKGARGRATEAEMASLLASGAKLSRREQNLRPEQIEALRLKREPKDLSVTCLGAEDGEGNVEYKFRIKDPHPVRLQQLITQMKFRLSEGNGECFYYIGIEDNGYPKGLEPADLDSSIATLHRMAASLDASVTLVHQLPAAWGRRAALLRVATTTAQEACHTDLRIVVAGSVDAGKSTLVAVLTHGSEGRPLLDNGRGLARMNVFRHKHEMQSGRTSSICHQLLGYDHNGRVINYATPAATALTPAEITGAASKVLTFLDMGGHERYLKTALYGMTALLPDYCLLCVCAVAGLGRITREHLAVAVALEVPVAVVVSKVELVCPERVAAVVAEVRQLVAITLQHESGPGAAVGQGDDRRVEDASPLVTSEADALASARELCQLHADSLASPTARGALRVHMPIFAVSAVTGAGLPVLHAFLNALQPGAGLAKGGSSLGASPGSCGDLFLAPAAGGGAGNYASSGPVSGSGSPRAGAVTALGAGVGAVTELLSSGDSAPACGDVSGNDVVTRPPEPPLRYPLPLPPQQQPHLYTPGAGAVSSDAAAAVATAAAASVPPTAAAAAVGEGAAVHFQVDGTFEVEGVGSVVSGTLLSGMVRLGQELMLGPTSAGGFMRVVVRQLQRSHVQVKQVRAGQTCTIAISPATEAGASANGAGYGFSTGSAGGAYGMGNGGTGFPFQGAPTYLPLGSSPGAAPVAGGLAAAAGGASAGGAAGDGFDDALAAAQTALELCLAGGSDDDEQGGSGGADGGDLFGFDCSDGPGFSPPPRSNTTMMTTMSPSPSPSPPHLGATSLDPGSLPLSMSVSQLHSTTSFCVGAGPGASRAPALSTSAPSRTLSASAGLVAAAAAAAAAVVPPLKGSVLLEPALQPRTSWTFEAVLILLGGHWPPRGLVSGHWPPAGDEDLDPACLPRPELAVSESVPYSEPPSDQAVSEPVSERQGSSGDVTSEPSGCTTPAGGAEGSGEAAAAASNGCAGSNWEGLAGGKNGCDVVEDGGECGSEDSIGERQASRVPSVAAAVAAAAAVVAATGPPQPRGEDGAVPAAGCQGSVAGCRTGGRRRRQRAAGDSKYVIVVHCGSVRQPALVLTMQELMDGFDGDPGERPHPELTISASTRAAAALLHTAHARRCPAATDDTPTPTPQRAGASPPGSPRAPSSPTAATTLPAAAPSGAAADNEDLGCLVRVVLRWQHRPEWLREGAKLLVRDRSDGRVAGAGFVRRVLF